MRITVDIEDKTLEDLMKITGEKKMSPAVGKVLTEYVRRHEAKKFGNMLREGVLDYPVTNEGLERNDA